ncbi:MAG: AMP-binding protein, partial [Gammaproteobacteria bacterium]|nr:AMP-binding protein [Gammaproteobacteria bacterium]
EATQAAIKDGWMRTGDAGYLDEEGYLFVVDRLKDVIISGGENIHSLEIENVIAALPGVRGCAVIGVPDDRWGERVHAVVVPDERGAGITEAGVIDHCRRHLASYKCPKSVTLRQQPLPLSAANKVLKPQLKKEFIEAAGRGGQG